MDVIKSLNEFEININRRYNELRGKTNTYDLMEQDILHFIEFEKCDAVVGAKLLKKLKEVRKCRREIKDEYESLQSIRKRLSNAGLCNYKRPNKTYSYRIVTLESILKENED